MASDAFPADLIAAYDMGERLASGGFGSVYRARHRRLGREAAVKLLHAEAQADPAQVQRFVAEARLAAQVEHPHVVRVLDHGIGEGVAWIAYAFAPGPSVAQELERGALTVPRACAIGAQVARALAAAHARGIVHRDVKPDNVLETAPGHFALCDFGIALWNDALRVKTATGVIMGTPGYVAPELIEGRPATPASDIYALGVMLHEMIAGALPFPGGLAEVLRGHMERPPPDLRAAAGAELARVVQRALAKQPAQRHASADELAAALERLGERAPPRPTALVRSRPSAATAVVTRAPRDEPLAPSRRPLLAALAVVTVAVAFLARKPARVVDPPPPPTPAPSVVRTVAPPPRPARRRPEFDPQVRGYIERARGAHDLELHMEECDKLLEALYKCAQAADVSAASQRPFWVEQWIFMRDEALACRADPEIADRTAAKIRDSGVHQTVEREAFRLSLAKPGLARALDRAQLRIDDAVSATPALAKWIPAFESNAAPGMLTSDLTGLRVTDPMDALGLVQKPAVLFNLRHLLDPAWEAPAQRGALEELANVASSVFYEERMLRLKQAEERAYPPLELRRVQSHGILGLRVLLERVVGRGFPWNTQFKIVRTARHQVRLARRLLPHREKAFAAELDAALSRKGCLWMKTWCEARSRHDEDKANPMQHIHECQGLAQALVLFENQERLSSLKLAEIPRSTLQAWLRLRSDLSPGVGSKPLHSDATDLAALELAASWIPERELAQKLPDIKKAADWDE